MSEASNVGDDNCSDVAVQKTISMREKMKDFSIKTLAIIALIIEVLAVVAVFIRWG